MDGELVVQAPDGTPRFTEVITRAHSSAVVAGGDVRCLRRAHRPRPGRRRPVLSRATPAVARARAYGAELVRARPVVGRGADFFVEAARRGLEGVVLKRVDSTYKPGARSDAWRKVLNAEHPAFGRVARSHQAMR